MDWESTSHKTKYSLNLVTLLHWQIHNKGLRTLFGTFKRTVQLKYITFSTGRFVRLVLLLHYLLIINFYIVVLYAAVYLVYKQISRTNMF